MRLEGTPHRRPVQHPLLVALVGSTRIWSWFDTVLLVIAAACLAAMVSGWVVMAYDQAQVALISSQCSGGRCTQQLDVTAIHRTTVPGGGLYSISARTDICDLAASGPAGTFTSRFPGRACDGLAKGAPVAGLIWHSEWLQVTRPDRTWDATSHPENGIGVGLLLQVAVLGVCVFGGVLRIDLRTRWPPLRRFI